MHDDNLNPSAGSDEGAMARADLYKLANYSKKLFHLIHDDQELEAWIQAKITKAADYIASVYHYLEYEMKVSSYGEKLENSDVYSESVKRAFEQKLFEARLKLKKIKAKNEKEVKEVLDPEDIEAALQRHAEKSGPDFSAAEKSGTEYEPKKSKKSAKRTVQGTSYGGSKQKDDDKDDDLGKGIIGEKPASKEVANTKHKGLPEKKSKKDLGEGWFDSINPFKSAPAQPQRRGAPSGDMKPGDYDTMSSTTGPKYQAAYQKYLQTHPPISNSPQSIMAAQKLADQYAAKAAGGRNN